MQKSKSYQPQVVEVCKGNLCIKGKLPEKKAAIYLVGFASGFIFALLLVVKLFAVKKPKLVLAT